MKGRVSAKITSVIKLYGCRDKGVSHDEGEWTMFFEMEF